MAKWIEINTKLPKPCKFYFVVVRARAPYGLSLHEKKYHNAKAKILWYNPYDKNGNLSENPWNLSKGEEITHWKPLCRVPCINNEGSWKL